MDTSLNIGGEGLKEAYCGIISEFRVEVEDDDDVSSLPSRLTVAIVDQEGSDVEKDVLFVGGRAFHVYYVAKSVGMLKVDVCLDGDNVVSEEVPVREVSALMSVYLFPCIYRRICGRF